MRFTIERLQTDVMARLGEIARPQGPLSGTSALDGVPWPEDIIGKRAASYLGEVGSKLIMEASASEFGSGVSDSGREVSWRLMPCGLYGAEVRLPGGFLRLVSVMMSGWRRSVVSAVMPESPEWSRQWSAEAGIAGCPERPRAYVDCDGAGSLLRLVGSESEEDALEWLCGWSVPSVNEEGEFEFPESLYGDLVGAITEKLG